MSQLNTRVLLRGKRTQLLMVGILIWRSINTGISRSWFLSGDNESVYSGIRTSHPPCFNLFPVFSPKPKDHLAPCRTLRETFDYEYVTCNLMSAEVDLSIYLFICCVLSHTYFFKYCESFYSIVQTGRMAQDEASIIFIIR